MAGDPALSAPGAPAQRYLRGSELAGATVGTRRLRLLQVAAEVRVSVRRSTVQLRCAFPLQGLFRQVARRLGTAAVSGVP